MRACAAWLLVALAAGAVSACGAVSPAPVAYAPRAVRRAVSARRRAGLAGLRSASRSSPVVRASGLGTPPRSPRVALGGVRAARLRTASRSWPVAMRGTASRRAAIPILMYHVISAAPPGAAYPQLWVSRRQFAEQMAALRRAGYHAITLDTALRAWRRGGPLPRRPIVLSFDDGYLSDFTHARPVLAQLGWPGVLDLVLRNLEPGGITPRQVRALIADGWEVDSHTMTHADLTTLAPAALRYELVASRAAIRRRFGRPALAFCYPAGRYDARVVAAVEAAGYVAATTEDEGLGVGAERFALKRVRVSSGDTAARLLARLRAAPAQ